MITTILSSIFSVTIPIAFNYTIAVIILYLPDSYGFPSPARVSPYIIGGDDAVEHSIPWQVVTMSRDRNRMTACGGTLISSRHVLTAAHCEEARSSDIVILGAHEVGLDGSSDGYHRGVCKSVNHPDYNWSSNDYDIAILHLEEPVQFNDRVAPACLPEPGRRFARVEAGRKMTVSGWGLIKYWNKRKFDHRNPKTYPQVSNNLRKLDVPGISNEQCRKLYPGFHAHNMICAGYLEGEKDACRGDSGGL